MARIQFSGGPCHGRVDEYDAAQIGTGTALCGGVQYHLYPLVDAGFLALMPGARPPSDAALADDVDIYRPDEALRAWRHMQDAAGRRLPAHVNATKATRAAIRRVGRR